MRNRVTAQLVFVGLSLTAMPAFAQDMPADYASVLKTLGKQGDYKDNVLKVNIPRSDLKVSVDGIATPTPFGFGGWITIGRDDLPLKEMGASISSRMGLNTWAAFYGSDTDAVVAGDVAMRDTEVTPVLKALRAHGIEVVAIHHHMTTTQPTVYFLYYWGHGPAQKLATGVRAALDQLGKNAASHTN